MAVITGGPFNGVPFEWILGLFIVVIAIVGIVLAVKLRGKGDKKPGEPNENPTEQNLLALSPVDQNGNPTMGKLLSGVTVTDKEIMFSEPGVMNSDKPDEERQFTAPLTDVMPLALRDSTGNLVNIWGALKMQGEIVLYSFNDLAKRIKQKFDPLEADVREVGQHFIGGPPRLGGLPQLLQSTTGKVIIIGASVMIGMFFMFFLVVASGHYH